MHIVCLESVEQLNQQLQGEENEEKEKPDD